MTQQELADRINLSVSVIGAIERGVKVPSPQILRAIGQALGVGEEELVGKSPEDTDRLQGGSHL
jgi:transcriptional regulator with XRE-family HTH domain